MTCTQMTAFLKDFSAVELNDLERCLQAERDRRRRESPVSCARARKAWNVLYARAAEYLDRVHGKKGP